MRLLLLPLLDHGPLRLRLRGAAGVVPELRRRHRLKEPSDLRERLVAGVTAPNEVAAEDRAGAAHPAPEGRVVKHFELLEVRNGRIVREIEG